MPVTLYDGQIRNVISLHCWSGQQLEICRELAACRLTSLGSCWCGHAGGELSREFGHGGAGRGVQLGAHSRLVFTQDLCRAWESRDCSVLSRSWSQRGTGSECRSQQAPGKHSGADCD